jgi:hypothetical protein
VSLLYCSEEQVKARMSSDGTTLSDVHDQDVTRAVSVASRWVDRELGDDLRTFETGASSSTRQLPASRARWDRGLGCWVLSIPDCTTLATVQLDVSDGGTWTTYASTYWYTTPLDGRRYGLMGVPIEELVFPDLGLRCSGRYPLARLTGVFGWSTRPPAVEECAINCAKWILQNRDTRLGFAAFGDQGLARARSEGLFVPVRQFGRGGGSGMVGIA